MKKLRLLAIVCQVVLIGLLTTGKVFAQKTTIWIVRHAEKDLTDPANPDPELSAEGKQRASALAEKLKGEKIAAIFVTKYQRSGLTAKPLAEQIKLAPQVYAPTAYKETIAQILQEDKDKTVLIVGHSNTILPLLAALGIAPLPMATIEDDEYSYLFKVTIDQNGKATSVVADYGKPSPKHLKP